MRETTGATAGAAAGEVRRRIAMAGGRVTFARYMEWALYAPRVGYYRRGDRSPIGLGGDYFTSPAVSALFGRILARQFEQLRQELGCPDEFGVVECGGHGGQLRADVLAAAPHLEYRVVEVGDAMPASICGCVFSNELIDAMPVHRVRSVGGQWREIYVVVQGDGFGEEVDGLSDERLSEYLAALPAAVMAGYEVEVNLRALDWLAGVARHLHRGYVLTIDYGEERPARFAPHRPRGTLRCYCRHQVGDDPYVRVGEQDITSDVDFTALIDEGRRCGLAPVLVADQGHYLLQVGGEVIRQVVEEAGAPLDSERAAVHQLIHPGAMGARFKVLLQRKIP